MDRQEWLQWRKGGIGSSDAPIIMGVSRFKTRYELWEEKTSTETKEDDSNQFIKDAGNQAEGKIRHFFEIMSGKHFDPALYEMQNYQFLRSSLDGAYRWNGKIEEIIEIKLLGDADPDKKWTNAKENNIVPPEYFPQIQMQLMVTSAKKCYFVAYLYDKDDKFLQKDMDRSKLAVVEVFADDSYQADLMSMCLQFWTSVVMKQPPEFADADWKHLKALGATKLAEQFKLAKTAAKQAEENLQTIRDELVKIAEENGHPRLEINGIKLQHISKIGNVDYAKIPELQGINLEQYRKPGSKYWKIGE